MEFEVFKINILRPTLSIDMVQRVLQWERQKRCFGRERQGHMAWIYFFSKIFMNFLREVKTIEDKRTQENCRI
jgi:hypothetical protein